MNEDILKYAKKTKEKALDEKEVLLSLEKKLAEQEKKILSLLSDHHSNSDNNGIEMREKTSLLSSNNASSTGTKKSYGSTSDSLNPIVNITVAPEISTTVSSISQASKRVRDLYDRIVNDRGNMIALTTDCVYGLGIAFTSCQSSSTRTNHHAAGCYSNSHESSPYKS